MKISITKALQPLPDARPVEIVERKGLGHPDTISDALAEAFSVALSRFYLAHFGVILHHNVDKVLLWGGAAQPMFGGGRIEAPIEIFLAGRAVQVWQGVQVPVEELAQQSCGAWLREHMRFVDMEDIRLHCLVRAGSMDLEELFLRQQKGTPPLANDTSCGVGFAPFSELEQVVYSVEHALNSDDFKATHPETGEDIKVMGVRDGESIRLTIGCAFVDRTISDMEDYLVGKSRLEAAALAEARRHTGRSLQVEVNTADDPDRDSIFLTVTGTSAEAGDDGEAGRGNRTNGLITPGRPMTMESVAGKNPVTHVGKLYNVAAGLIAEEIVASIPEVEGVECALVSQIGKPVDQPQIVEIRLLGADALADPAVNARIEALVREQLDGIPKLWRDFVEGRLQVDAWPLR